MFVFDKKLVFFVYLVFVYIMNNLFGGVNVMIRVSWIVVIEYSGVVVVVLDV